MTDDDDGDDDDNNNTNNNGGDPDNYHNNKVFGNLSDNIYGYSVDMPKPKRPSRLLRSGSDELLVISRCKTMLGDRAFSTSAPTLWNGLLTSRPTIYSVPSSETLPTIKKRF